MRASSGPLTTLLMFVPLLAVPLLAIFGTPQTTPATASSRPELATPQLGEIGVGESVRHTADDLFQPLAQRTPSAPGTRHDQLPAWPADDAWKNPPSHQPATPQSRQRAVANQSHNTPASQDNVVSQETWPETSASTTPPARRAWYEETARRQRATNPQTEYASADADDRDRQPASRDVAQLDPQPGNSFLSVDDDPRSQEALPARNEQPAPGQPAYSNQPFADTATEPAESADENPFASSRQPLLSEPAEFAGNDGPAPSLTWRSAVQRLGQLGIHDYQLSPGTQPQAFHFSCIASSDPASRVVRRFESEAADPLAAVADVIRQVEDWHGRQ